MVIYDGSEKLTCKTDSGTKKRVPLDRYESHSMADVLAWIEKTPRQPKAHTASKLHNSSPQWDLGLGWGGALAMAKAASWPEGADKIRRGVLQLEAAQGSLGTSMALSHSVAGFQPDVPAFLAGDPECMYWLDPADCPTLAGPVVSIGVQTICSASTSAETMLNRGIAVLTACDELEAAGYRCEITAVYAGGDERGVVAWEHVIKQAGDQWNPGAAAFALAHMGWGRRLGFAFKERAPRAWQCTTSAYGNGRIVPASYWAKWDLALSEYVTGDPDKWSTPEAALKTVQKQLGPVLEERQEQVA